jgi:hypothetical protein
MHEIIIVGGCAGGFEPAADLHNATRVLAAFGLTNIDPDRYACITPYKQHLHAPHGFVGVLLDTLA